MQKLPWETFTAYFVAYFVVFAFALPTKLTSLRTDIEACKAQLFIFVLPFFPRTQMVRDGQSPNQNLEKFYSFQFINICTWELDHITSLATTLKWFQIVPGKHRKSDVTTVFAYSRPNTPIDHWECAYCLKYFINWNIKCKLKTQQLDYKSIFLSLYRCLSSMKKKTTTW